MNSPKRPGQRGNGRRLTRRRVPLSCVACRVRKLKCNRETPCQNCLVRGESNASCTYAEKAEKRSASQPKTRSTEMQERLSRLEQSILSMMSSDTSSIQPHQKPSGLHKTNGDGIKESQAGGARGGIDSRSTHWDAILSDLGAMKDAWSEESDKTEFSNNMEGTIAENHRLTLLGGLTQPPTRDTILTSLPSRKETDMLVARFFDSYSPAIPCRYVLHRATFYKQYDQHWSEPSKTKIIWIGLLFSMLCIAMHSYKRTNEVPSEYQENAPALVDLYRLRTAQCLTIADITRPVDFMLETLFIYANAEYVDESDGDMGTTLLSAIMIKVALQQGYHRDPTQFPSLSVFQGEMRRRIWSVVNQHDMLFSIQIGLPKSIRFDEFDTQRPRNIHEHELYGEMTELPPSRPLTEDTEVCYQVVKYGIMRALGQIVEFLNVLEPRPYEVVLKLDMNMMEARANIPPHLLLRKLEEMAEDAPSRVMERFIPQLFYHKAMCLLHRKYWDSVPTGSQAKPRNYSRETSIASSLALLDHQATMHRASQPGGVLQHMKWYLFSITNHDFLLAAMILCLDLMSNIQKGDQTIFSELVVSEDQKIEAIKQSRAIWGEIVNSCRDAKRAVNILTSVLNKLAVKREEQKRWNNVLETHNEPSTAVSIPYVDSLPKDPYATEQFGLGTPLVASQHTFDINMDYDFLDTLGSDLTVPGDFNWDGWDQALGANMQTLDQNSFYRFQSLETMNMNNKNWTF